MTAASVVAIMTDSKFFHLIKANQTIWKLCSVFIIAPYCTIWQLPVFTSQQLYSACSSTQPLIRLPRQPCDPVHFLSS